LGAGLFGGIGQVGMGSLGVLGLPGLGRGFDDLFFSFLFVEPTNFGSWILDIP